MDEDTQSKSAEQEATQDGVMTSTPVEQPSTASVEFPEDGSVLQGGDGKEVVVHDKDEDGNVTGWHKEAQE